MKKLVLLRFGDRPDRRISDALAPHIHGRAILLPAPGLVCSVFESNSSEEIISQDLKTTDALFFLLELNANSMHLPEPIMAIINSQIGIEPVVPPRVPLTFDQILDKINAVGIESLTPEEKAVLDGGS